MLFRQALGPSTSAQLETVEESSFDKELREAQTNAKSSRKTLPDLEQNLTASDEFMLSVAQKLDKEKVNILNLSSQISS